MESGQTNREVPAGHARLREAALPAAAGAAVLSSSLLNFLNHNQYPILRPEVGLIAAALLLAVVLTTVLYVYGGRYVRVALQILLVYVALDLNFDGFAVPVATIAIAVILQRHAIPFVAVAASVVLVTVLANIAVAEHKPESVHRAVEGAAARELPVLVHLILDEHLGIEGLLNDTPVAAAAGEEVKLFYLRHGFRLFGGAYSEHMRTVNAIPQMLDFGTERPWDPSNAVRSVLSSNAYFDRLGELGYRIFLSQTDYIDYCNNRFVVQCRTRRAADLVSTVAAPISVFERAEVVGFEFGKLSGALLLPAAIYSRLRHASPVYAIPPVGALETLRGLAEELKTAKPGDSFFVHELLPHTPYVLDPECRIRKRAAWRDQSTGPRDGRMRAYVDQIACLNKMLEAVFEAAGPSAVIVVHGDHGSRITEIEPKVGTAGQFVDRDLIASYSTLFAVRASAIEAGYDARALPIAKVLHELARAGFRSADVTLAPDFKPSVVLEGPGWKPAQRHPLPAGWPSGRTP